MREKLWGGRFAANTDVLVEHFTASIAIDQRLYAEDIRGSLAHARMLGRVGVLSAAEVEAICAGLEQIATEIRSGSFSFDDSLEDIHMHIESRLIELIGDTGKKLHTGRSRNDQVATDMRLYTRGAIDRLLHLLHDLQQVFVDLAEREVETILPGLTHLQVAQPVTFGHHCMA